MPGHEDQVLDQEIGILSDLIHHYLKLRALPAFSGCATYESSDTFIGLKKFKFQRNPQSRGGGALLPACASTRLGSVPWFLGS